jgi:hypothetical protein
LSASSLRKRHLSPLGGDYASKALAHETVTLFVDIVNVVDNDMNYYKLDE